MTQISFFTNFRLTVIYCAFGYLFLFGGSLWAKQIEMKWILIGATVFCLIIALYYVTKDYNKEYDKIKPL